MEYIEGEAPEEQKIQPGDQQEEEEEPQQMEITPAKLLKTNITETVETFEELGLNPDLLRGIFGYGYE